VDPRRSQLAPAALVAVMVVVVAVMVVVVGVHPE
jgi:hypothetical protein